MEPRDRPIQALTWDYPPEGPEEEPSAEAVLIEINGRDATGYPLGTFTKLRDDGSTRCGCWIYCGAYAGDTKQTARRRPGREQSWVAPEWGWAWPANRRILYNRASADPEGRPWSERKRYVFWDPAIGRWTGADAPDFRVDMPPDYRPSPGARAEMLLRGDEPFVMQADGKGWLYVPNGLQDGPLPVHYEPHESLVENPLYSQGAAPVRQRFEHSLNRTNRDAERYPYVITTYRLTEHHTAGGMSRFLPFLAELQPEMFCEVSPELARERDLVNGGWAVISTARSTIEARVLVTDRLRPLQVGRRLVHQVGLPYHWGSRGLARGASANDLLSIVLDPNVHIQEAKAATCDIRPGRLSR
jgi:formate dehydrogenase major subunit